MLKVNIMLRQRTHYWTCSKFADWIRGEKKPFALEWGQWDEWKAEQKKKRPFRFWLSDTFLGWLQNIVYYPSDLYYSVKIYIRNRWIDKTHVIQTGFKPGKSYEIDDKMLHGLFNELVDFVEIELAASVIWQNKNKYKTKKGRCLEAAHDYFNWANNLKEKNDYGKKVLTEQAKSSKQIQKLYEWWKNKRPARLDPYVVSGYNDTFKDNDDIFKFSSTHTTKLKRVLTKLEKTEKDYDEEDTDMLIELIKIRHHLWS
jgi:hypothetical protein